MSASGLRRKAAASLWKRHDAEFRDPHQVAAQWDVAQLQPADPDLFRHTTRGEFWETLERSASTLLVTREYEHLVMALAVREGEPALSYLRIPHPSGIVFDRGRGVVHLASTRNPNLVHDLMPVSGVLDRSDVRITAPRERPLVPVRSRVLAGSFYLHDMAMIGGRLHANAVGHNAVVRLDPQGGAKHVWWPRCVERASGPELGRNRIQLNSIGAGQTVRGSFYSASSDRLTTLTPGHVDYPVDRRGVIFSGATREPIVRGLTRPHSVRIHRRRLWVDNSGYGEVGRVEGERFQPVARLAGWTRGLCFVGGVAFVGTSRVIPRFRSYAPGLDVDRSECGVHAIDVRSGRLLGSLVWPRGNQIFGIEAVPARVTSGFPFVPGRRNDESRLRDLFYVFTTHHGMERKS